MTVINPFAAVTQPDVASLTRGGVFFRCYLWLNNSNNSVGSSVFVEQEHGQDVEVQTTTVRDTENDGTSGDLADCPKLIAVGNRYFIAHWIEAPLGSSSGSVDMRRAILDVDDLDAGWVDQGASNLHFWGLYDVDVIRGGSDFVVAKFSSGTQINVAQFDSPYSWLDTVHNTNVTVTPDSKVIGVTGETDRDDDTHIVYQDGSNALQMLTMDTETGANQATVEVFADHPDTPDYATVGLALFPDTSDVVVMAETRDTADFGTEYAYLSTVVAKRARRSTVLTSCQYLRNASLVSRPWCRAAGFALQTSVYSLVGFKSSADGQEWDQTYGFVLDWDATNWASGAAVGSIRPIPVSAITNGTFDGRGAGAALDDVSGLDFRGIGRRMNHVSHVSLAPQFDHGPDVRSVTVAAQHWEKIISVQDADDGETQPAQASIRGVRFYHEDPWTVRQDDSEPTLPSTGNFAGLSPYSGGQSVEVGTGLIYSGGVLHHFEGRSLVEVGFCWVPEIMNATASGGGALSAGDYWYTITATWTDSRGQVHRGAPARPQMVSASLNDGTTLVVRPVNLTLKDDTTRYPETGRIYLEVWRTTLSGGAPGQDATGNLLFRRAFAGQTVAIEETPTSDHTVARQSIVDVNSDASVSSADLLPWQLNTTTLQWSPAVPAPVQSARVMTTWNNRVWIVPMDDPRVIRYSDEQLPIGSQASLPEFFDSNVFRFDGRGEITAMQPMDNQLIVFTRDAIYAVTGEGNDGTGTGATLTLQVIGNGTGCIEPRSVVLAPPGIMFQAPKGYYMLRRSLELDYLSAGAAVEDLIREMGNIRAATLMEDRPQVRLVGNRSSAPRPIVLIYDYQHQQWSTAPMQSMAGASTRLNDLQHATMWRGREGETCHVVLAQGGLSVERGRADTIYSDENYTGTGQAIPIDVTVEWLHIGGIAGFQRLRQFVFIADMQDDCEMAYDLYVDRDGSFDESSPLDSAGWASPAPSHLVIRPSQQKCSSVLVRLYETGSIPLTENLRLTGVALDVGVKKGTLRVSNSNRGT